MLIIILDLSNYATKTELDYATDVDKDFIALKAEFDKLDINKLTVSTSLNNLKTKEDDLDVGKLKTDTVDLKKIK